MPELQEESLIESLNKLVKAVIRRRWWLVVPACTVALIAAVVAIMIPDKFESQATILVERQQVPERFVAANTTTDVQEALLGMTDSILSRTQLLHIIGEFHLYPKDQNLPPEQLVELMRKNIKIAPLRNLTDPHDLNAFTISFVGATPQTAHDVAAKLTDLFITESGKSREKQSADTTDFLSDTLNVAAEDLKQREERLREFKMGALGELPENQQGNLQILAGLHTELQNTMANVNRAREQQTYLQSLLSQYEMLASTGANAPGGPSGPNPLDAIKAQIAQLHAQRADLISRYTDQYPDVVKIDQQLKDAQALLAATKAAAAEPPPPDPTPAPGGKSAKPAVQTNATIAQVKSQLEANRIEIDNATVDQRRIEASIADYQRRLNLTPVREQQLADLSRGYDQSKQHYDDLLNKKTQSELATNLERRQQGERFNIIDPPNLPSQPVTPDHIKISLGGIVLGLVFGAALAIYVESKDSSLFTEQDLRATFSFPLMLGLPAIRTIEEEQKRTKHRKLEWALGSALCVLVLVVQVLVYLRN